MLIFWYSQDANVTPPVCLAAYAAAGIAKSPPMETGFTSWKLAKGLYIIPLMFVYTPLLFEGPLHEVIWAAVAGTLGLFGFVVTVEGFYHRRIGIVKRAIVGFSSLALLFPRITGEVFAILSNGSTVEKVLSEEELLAKAAAEAARIAQGLPAEAVESAVRQVPFWPDQMITSLAGLSLLLIILLPQRLNSRKHR
jgi:hypothetical protein